MVKAREMPYSEKYANVLDSIKLSDTLVPSFVQKHLGNQAVDEFRSVWQQGVKPIPEDASFEEKYELAFSNWIWMGKGTFSFIRTRLGEEGMEQFKRADVEALKQKNAGAAMFILRLLRALAPGLAFNMTAKQMAYQLQWLSPFSVSELTRRRAVFNMPHCKFLDFPDTEDLCLIGCQSIYPMWLAEQFGVGMEAELQGKSCTITITSLR